MSRWLSVLICWLSAYAAFEWSRAVDARAAFHLFNVSLLPFRDLKKIDTGHVYLFLSLLGASQALWCLLGRKIFQTLLCLPPSVFFVYYLWTFLKGVGA